MSDNIKVVVKVRPLISREKEDKLPLQWRVINNTLHQLDSNGKESGAQYTFDKVYDEETKTVDVYKDVAKPIVEAAIAGFNGTIFAYGQTSSGKTYTMSGTEDSPGIVQLAVLNLFKRIKCIPDRDFLVRVSYIEIYNETLKDLLNGGNDKIKVRDTLQGVKVDATEKFTSSPEEVIEIMKEGEANRQIGATLLNEESSRSHTIFQITIESREHIEGEEIAGSVNVSTLNLVDLAGSERSGQTGATGKRFKEGTHINKSLSALALVIKQLSEDPHKHINYRDSKLTRILQNALGGNAKTSIICAVTPAALEETVSTLQFANRAKAIKNKPEVNAVATDATKLQDLTKQLSKLQMELAVKNHIEEDNRNLLKQIAGLQKMILNGFGQQSVGGCRRKTWCAPRRQTISTLDSLDEDKENTIQRFRTPNLKYNPMSLPNTKDFQPIQRPSQLPPVSEETVMVTPAKNTKDNSNDDLVVLSDSEDESTSNTSHCSPYHKCYSSSKTPPCVLRKNAKTAEKNLKDIVELTKREKMYNPEVVEYMEKLEKSTNTIARLEDDLRDLNAKSQEKDSQMALLKDKIILTENEVKMFSSAKAELEVRCKEYDTKITDLEVSYETLKMKAKLREEELLSLLNEQRRCNKPREHVSGKSLSRTLDKDFGNFMDLSKDISLVGDNDSSIDTSHNGATPQDLVNEMKQQITAKNETIISLESDLLQQKLRIETLENTCKDLHEQIKESNSKLEYINDENDLLKSSIATLNSTINSQKENLEAANNDMKSYTSVIQELQARLMEKSTNVNLNISDSLLESMVAHEETVIANNENLRNIIHSFQIALETRSKEIISLKSALEYKTSSTNSDLSTEQSRAKEEQRCALVEEIQRVKYQLDENMSIINKLKQDNEDLVKNKDDLSRKLLHAEKQKLDVEKQNIELKNQNEEYKNQLCNFNANHDKLLKNLNEFKNNLSEHQKEKEEFCKLQNVVVDKDNIITKLKSEIVSKDNLITSHINERVELQKEVESKNNSIAELECEIQTKNILIASLGSEHAKLQSEFADKEQRIADLESEISTKNDLITSLNREHAKIQNEVLTKDRLISVLEGEILELQKEVKSKNNCIAELESEIQSKNILITSLRSENTKLQSELAAKEQRIADLESEILTKDNVLRSLNDEHTESQDYLCKSKSVVTRLQQLLSVLKGDVCVESEIIDDSVAIFSTLYDRINVVEVTAKEVVSQKDLAVDSNYKLEQEIETLRAQIETSIQEKAKIESDRDALNKDINQLTKELEGIKHELQELKASLQTANESNQKLSDDITTKENLISSLQSEQSNYRLELDKALQQDLLSKKEIDNLQALIKTQVTSDTLLQSKDEEISKLKNDSCIREKLLDENIIQLQKLSKTLDETIQNRDHMLENINKKATDFINKFETQTEKNLFADSNTNAYHNIIQILSKATNDVMYLIDKKTFTDIHNKELEETKQELDILRKHNDSVEEILTLTENENKHLLNELEEIKIVNKRLSNDLSTSAEVLQRLQVELKEKLDLIESLESKIEEWKENFAILEESMKQQILQLQDSNFELQARWSQYSVGREPSDVDSNQTYNIRKSLTNILVTPRNKSPQSLLTLCCNKIIDAIQPSETDLKSANLSSSSTNLKTVNIETQTDHCDCAKLSAEKEIMSEENVQLKTKVDFLEFVNLNLLKEQEDVRKELKLLLEPAYDLQKKISNHKTNLSTLTATTYAENKLLKSQVKVLQHHNNRFYTVCQKDLPTFKKSLQELSTILKNTHLATKLESSINRYSLPEVLDKNCSTSNFRDESTLDGDMLMLDTNVTLASVDNTLLNQDQSCLDGTQIYLDTEINTDLIQEIDPNVLHTQLQVTSLENDRLSEKIESLKEENAKLHEKLENSIGHVKSVLVYSHIDVENSPIKLNRPLTEGTLQNTDQMTNKLCERCNNENTSASHQLMSEEMKSLTNELHEVRDQKRNLEKKCADLNEDLIANDKLILKNRALEQENKMKLLEIDQLTRKIKDFHRLQEENDLLSTQVMESIEDSDNLKKEVDILRDSNSILTAKCAELEELIKSKTTPLSTTNTCPHCSNDPPGSAHSTLSRSHSDSESSSCFNKLSTLQNELLAGREDCKTISEDVATIKNHLDRSNLSMSHNMDLDDSMGESNIFTLSKELNAISPKTQKFQIPVVPEECPLDFYGIDKSDCFNYYIEKTGAENNLDQDTKIIDVMKMFYNNLVTQHANEVENLINNLKDFEESRNDLHQKINSLSIEYEKISEELKGRDNRLNSITNVLSQIRNNISILDKEMSGSQVEKNAALVAMFKDNVLNILEAEFQISMVSVFESLMIKVASKQENDLHETIRRCSELQQTMEVLTLELSKATENLNQIKCQLSDKEKEYNLLKAQKEKIQEIANTVTLDMVKKDQELTDIISESCRILVNYKVITPNEIDLTLPLNENVSLLIKKFIQQSKETDLASQEKHNLKLEVTRYKSVLDEKEQELETLKSQVGKLHEVCKSATDELLVKNEELESERSLHEQLNKVYEKKIEENDANIKIIETLTQEILILKETVTKKEDSLQALQLHNNKQEVHDSEVKVKTEELIESINRLEHENEQLKSINEMIRKESEQNALELAKADETIKRNKIEIDKMTAEILALNQSMKESLAAVDSLKLEAKSLLDQNVDLKKQFEDANEHCSRLKLNIKTHEKSAEVQCRFISRLNQEKEDCIKVISEKDKQLEELTQKCTTLQKDNEKLTEDTHQCRLEVNELKKIKESLERQISEFENQTEGHKSRASLGSAGDNSRRRRQSLLDSKRKFSEDKQEPDHKRIEAYFTAAAKPDDMFMDVDDGSNRSTPVRNRRSDSFQSRNEESDRDEGGSRPSSALERRRRRQSIHDQHRIAHQTPDQLNTLNEINSGNKGDQNGEVLDLKKRLELCEQELEELKERYREVDEECEICAEYLRERDEQCMRLKGDNEALQQQITELNEKLHNASAMRSQEPKCSYTNASVNTDEDWANLHSVVVDRMSFDREVEKNKELQRVVNELRCKNSEMKATLTKIQKNVERAAKNKADLQELEATKLELKSCKRELEEYKERCKELDEECETCGEYLRERDEQVCRLKEARDALEARLEQLLEKEAGSKAHSVRKKRQSMHDQNRNSTVEYADASTETGEDLLNSHVERDNTSLVQSNEIQQLKMAMDILVQQKNALDLQLRAIVTPQQLMPPVYVATGSAIVQNQHMTDIMKENQKLKKMNAKLITICKKRGKPLGESNRENDDPADMG